MIDIYMCVVHVCGIVTSVLAMCVFLCDTVVDMDMFMVLLCDNM